MPVFASRRLLVAVLLILVSLLSLNPGFFSRVVSDGSSRPSTAVPTTVSPAWLSPLWLEGGLSAPTASTKGRDFATNEMIHNARTMSKLFACLERNDCRDNQKKIVLLAQHDLHRSFDLSWNGGEAIWLRSFVRSLNRLSITSLYVPGDAKIISLHYALYPGMIRSVFGWDDFGSQCASDKDCVKSSQNPLGIPIEQIHETVYFGCQSIHPLGEDWCMAAEDVEASTYLGYEIEEECTAQPVVPHSERPRRIWVLAKRADYLPYDDKRTSSVWTYGMLERLINELNIELVGAYEHEHGTEDHPLIRNLLSRPNGGQGLPFMEFSQEMGKSLAVLGIGQPYLSPTPWYALCSGTAFINPMNSGLTYKSHWFQGLQHPAAGVVGDGRAEEGKQAGVYNVEMDDIDSLIAAVRKAIQPHPRIIIPEMTMAAMDVRVQAIVDKNWTAHALDMAKERPEVRAVWESTL